MASPLQGKIAAAINKGFQSTFYDATLTRVTPGTPDEDEPWTPVAPTTADYACKAIVEEYSDYHRANTLIEANDRKVLVLADSLSTVPNPATDTITIRGETYTIVPPAKIDPANVVWEIQARK